MTELTVDEARLNMVHELHEAVFGATWARPNTPAEVWRMLLDRVEQMRDDEALCSACARRPIDTRIMP